MAHRTFGTLANVAPGLQLCYEDAYARTTPARVTAVRAETPVTLTLDRTVFYPGGGGQPADAGFIRRTSDGATWVVRS